MDTNGQNMKILLFDMDGVLLEPRGYHQALIETVRTIGEVLGYRDATLSSQDIAAFEAAGITCEWDSSAICSVLLMLPLWERFPDVSMPTDLGDDQIPRHDLPPPSWDSFFDALNQAPSESADPMLRAGNLLGAGNAHKTAINQILSHAHHIHKSLTHRIFQELVLGSEVFAQTYQLPAWFETESYLRQYDRPTLVESRREQLLTWLQQPDHLAVIVTNRPSLPPDGFGTPEAEIGARCVDLEHFPLVGYGDMTWLSTALGVDVLRLRKPAPVHVLAALLRGIGLQQEDASLRATDLALSEKFSSPWKKFDGAEVFLFEDTTAGVKSALAAQEVLAEFGVGFQLRLIGVSGAESKRTSLARAGAEVYADLSAALMAVLD